MKQYIPELYSNVDPALLIFEGQEYGHLREVRDKKVEKLLKQLRLKVNRFPLEEELGTISSKHIEDAVREIWDEEMVQLNVIETSRQAKHLAYHKESASPSTSVATLDLSVGIASLHLDLEKTVSTLAKAGLKSATVIAELFANSRHSDAPDIMILGQHREIFEPLVGLGQPLTFERKEVFSEGHLHLTSPSTTFEYWTNGMPILNAIVFCGAVIGAGDIRTNRNISLGFIYALLPTSINGYGREKALRDLEKLVNWLLLKGGSMVNSNMAQRNPEWQMWSKQFRNFRKRDKQFAVMTECKPSVIRDIVILAKENNAEVAIRVCDYQTAAVAFGLAQVNLCKIVPIGVGASNGPRIYGINDEINKSDNGHIETVPSFKKESCRLNYGHNERRLVLGVCSVPEEFIDKVMDVLEKNIADTMLLGIENGDAPGTVIMTPSFCVLSRTGAIKSLEEPISQIAKIVAENCESCSGQCISWLHGASSHSYIGCRTLMFINTLLSIYVGGVLRKAGMNADRYHLCDELHRNILALKELRNEITLGLDEFLACWYILRSGKKPPVEGSIMGLEMDGQIHGLQHALKPGTQLLTKQPLISFDGHIAQGGGHTMTCIVFRGYSSTFYFDLEQAIGTEVYSSIEQQKLHLLKSPDVLPEQLLFVEPERDFIAVRTALYYPDGQQLPVSLGYLHSVYNVHRLVEPEKDELVWAVPLQVSQCVDGYRIVGTTLDDLVYMICAYDNEPLQSWIFGALPALGSYYQGCRPMRAVVALAKPNQVVIQGSSYSSDD